MRTLLLLAGLAAAAHAQATPSLVADRESVAPGEVVRVGVRFQLDPHWHVYWKNPGDSGQAPRVRWKGVNPSPLEWPVPKRVPTPPFMTFGYEGEVTLTASILVPEAYPGATFPVAADVDWLVCDANGCVPGEAKLSMEIPVRAGESPRREIATGLPVRPTGAVSARYDGTKIALLAPGAPSFFFPADMGVIEPSAPQPRAGGGLMLTPVKTRAEPVQVLRGVLTFESGPAWEVEVAVEPGAPSGSGLKWLLGGAAAVVVIVALTMLVIRKKERTS